MKILISTMILSLVALADTYQYEMSGMHCGACKKAVSSTVCKIPGVKTCDVSVGSMTLTSEEGQKLDQAAIKKAVQEAADKFKSEYAIASSKEITTSAKSADEAKNSKKSENSKKD
jgi:copper chaperone CopZ